MRQTDRRTIAHVGKMKNANRHKIVVKKPEGYAYLPDLGVDSMILLRWILKK